MNFKVTFCGTSQYQVVRGLTLLDLTRQLCPTAQASECVDSVIVSHSANHEIDETSARECGHFQNDDTFWVNVTADFETWRRLFHTTAIELKDGKLSPVIKADSLALFEAWQKANYPKELTFS
jgi:hypothetical protein